MYFGMAVRYEDESIFMYKRWKDDENNGIKAFPGANLKRLDVVTSSAGQQAYALVYEGPVFSYLLARIMCHKQHGMIFRMRDDGQPA